MSARVLLAVVLLVACGADDAITGSATDAPAGDAAPGSDAPPASLTCGAGTTEIAGACTAPASSYIALRVADATIGANGHTGYLVRAIAVDATGAPLAPYATIAIDRASAGTLSASNVTLSPLGGTATFTPCDHATAADCLGPVTFTMTLPSAPATVVASTTAMLAVPTGVSSAAPCLDSGPATIVAAGYEYPYIRIDAAAWLAFSSASGFELKGRPTDPNFGDTVDVSGDSPLGPGIYDNTPLSLQVIWTGADIPARVQVQANSTQDIVVSWEQPYDHPLEGCMRYTP